MEELCCQSPRLLGGDTADGFLFDALKFDWRLLKRNHSLRLTLQHVAASSGSGGADLDKLVAIVDAVPDLKYICLDVANGYSEHFVEFVKRVREKFPKHTIMVRRPQGVGGGGGGVWGVKHESDTVNFTGWQRGHRGDGGGAHPVWC